MRRGEIADIDWIIGELKRFSAFYGPLAPQVDDHKFAFKYLANIVQEHVLYVATKDGVQVGFIAGLLIAHPYRPSTRLLSEQFWWVVPEHQGSRAGGLLFKAFDQFGQERADQIAMSILPQSQVNAKALEKRGYQLAEMSYVKEVKG